MKPICLACSSPLQNTPFSLSIKLNDIFLQAPFMPCQVPPEMQADLDVCVCSEKETSESRSKHRVINISTPYCLSGLLLWEDSCFESVSGENIWAKGILDLKHGCFVSIWTGKPRQTDWKWQGNYSYESQFFALWKHFIFWEAISVL